jgi:hypothetical protein
LVNEEAVAALKLFSGRADLIGEVDGLLVDEELFEGERHGSLQRWRGGKMLW